MTIDEYQDDLASSWHKYMRKYYYEELRFSLEKAFKLADHEGLSAEFYDYFNTASPEELKGLIRESSVPLLQEMIGNVSEEVVIDKRQVSIELFMKNLPCSSDVIIGSRDFYQLAIPKLFNDNLDLKGSWESRPVRLSGKIVSLSESFYLSDIKTFSCTNVRCRNSSRVIRHVGFDHLEQVQELGTEQLKPEVFVSGISINKSANIIKCHNCREEISELYPFRSNLEFKLSTLQLDDSVHTINVLLCGSKTCSMIKLSDTVSLIGFPELTVEVPFQLKQIVSKVKSLFYFETYGVENELHDEPISMKDVLNILVSQTSESLRFPLLLLLCQLIGSANSIKLDLCFLDLDETILNRIVNLFNYVFGSNDIMGYFKQVQTKGKGTQVTRSFKINITDTITKNDNESILYTKDPKDQILKIPIELSTTEEADIILNQRNQQENHKTIPFKIPNSRKSISLSIAAIQKIKNNFLGLRRSLQGCIPLQFTVEVLTKLTQISAAASNRIEANEDDAEFAIMIHTKYISNHYYDLEFDDSKQIMSPSISFDFDGDQDQSTFSDTFEESKIRNLAHNYGISLN